MQNNILESIIMFPLWWYSKGLLLFWRKFKEDLNYYYLSLSVGVWLKNIFVPMYGEFSWSGRIISFFMRLANIIVRSILLVIMFFFFLFLFLLKVVGPAILVALILIEINYLI